MTLLAVVSLVAAAAVARTASARGVEVEHLRVEVEGLTLRNQELEAQLAEEDRGIDFPPCLGRSTDGGVVRLLRVTAEDGFRLQQLWHPDSHDVALEVPEFLRAQPVEELSTLEFRRVGARVLGYGDRVGTFDRRCRFFVEFKRGPTISAADYAAAYGEVTKFFFIGNSSEVSRELARAR